MRRPGPGFPKGPPGRGARWHGDATATSLVPSAGGERSLVSKGRAQLLRERRGRPASEPSQASPGHR